MPTPTRGSKATFGHLVERVPCGRPLFLFLGPSHPEAPSLSCVTEKFVFGGVFHGRSVKTLDVWWPHSRVHCATSWATSTMSSSSYLIVGVCLSLFTDPAALLHIGLRLLRVLRSRCEAGCCSWNRWHDGSYSSTSYPEELFLGRAARALTDTPFFPTTLGLAGIEER